MIKTFFSVFLLLGLSLSATQKNHGNAMALNSWEFNVFECTTKELTEAAFSFFANRGFLKDFSISEKDFRNYLQAVQANYQSNPYHNYLHAIEVTHFIYLLDHKLCLSDYLTKTQRFALFLAALNHDIAHPGKSAIYQKNLLTDIYEKYGEGSTLEKYHIDVAFALLEDPEWSILPKNDSEYIKAFMKKLILATDMQKHQYYMEFCANKSHPEDLRAAIIAIKSADLSQLVRGKEISEKWVFRLRKELYLEKVHNFSQKGSDFLRESDFILQESQSQKNFIEKFAYPVYSLLESFYPKLQGVKKRLTLSQF